jgi:ABC-type dipeptide/oligopeptide/nickel transport system permease component
LLKHLHDRSRHHPLVFSGADSGRRKAGAQRLAVADFPAINPALVSVALVWRLLMNYAGPLTIPDDFIEATRVDGASEPRILFSILMPMLAPSLTVAGVLTFNLSIGRIGKVKKRADGEMERWSDGILVF